MAVVFNLPFTQNATIVAFLITLLAAVVLSPFGVLELKKGEIITTLIRLVHLFSFATWLGSQVWVTFFAGITMYRVLPRHTFGLVQSKMFPKYFRLGTILSSLAVITFFLAHPFGQWETREKIQGYSLVVSLLMVVSNLFYFEPQTTRCTFQKHKFEKEIQAGQAIGKVEEDKATELRKNPEYCKLETRFVRLHTYASIANLLALAAQAIHLWYLAGHLDTI